MRLLRKSAVGILKITHREVELPESKGYIILVTLPLFRKLPINREIYILFTYCVHQQRGHGQSYGWR